MDESAEFDIEAYNKANDACIQDFLESFDLSSATGIRSIRIDALKSWESRAAGVPSLPEQILFKQASYFKHTGQLDLAVECLQKVNEFLPIASMQYQGNNYLRLVEYLKLSRRFDEARAVEAKLIRDHPDLFEIVKNKGIAEILNNRLGHDYVQISTSGICPKCSPYKMRIYSISGKDKRFPSFSTLPRFLAMNKCDLCGCYIGLTPAFISHRSDIEIRKLSIYSCSPPIDKRTEEQKQYFLTDQSKKAYDRQTKMEYDWLWEHHPVECPKSLSAYSRMKNLNSGRFQSLCDLAVLDGVELVSE